MKKTIINVFRLLLVALYILLFFKFELLLISNVILFAFYFLFLLSLGLVLDLFIKKFTDNEAKEVLDNYDKLGRILLLNLILITELIGVFSGSSKLFLLIILLSGLIPIYYSIRRKIKIKYHLAIYLLGLLFIIFIILLYVPINQCINSSCAAKDARIKAAMDQMRSDAEVFKQNGGYYNSSGNTVTLTACINTENTFITTGSDIMNLCNDIQEQGSGALAINISNGSSAPAYCISKVLQGGKTWCIDSAGVVGSTDISCDKINFDCK